jgi:hypothetical protein
MMAAGAKAVRHGRILRLIAPTSSARVHRRPLSRNELALPKSAESGKLSLEIR